MSKKLRDAAIGYANFFFTCSHDTAYLIEGFVILASIIVLIRVLVRHDSCNAPGIGVFWRRHVWFFICSVYPILQIVAGLIAIRIRSIVERDVVSSQSAGLYVETRYGYFQKAGRQAVLVGVQAMVVGTLTLLGLFLLLSMP